MLVDDGYSFPVELTCLSSSLIFLAAARITFFVYSFSSTLLP